MRYWSAIGDQKKEVDQEYNTDSRAAQEKEN